MQYSEANERLLSKFPELAEPILLLRNEWGDEEPGPYIVYEDVFRLFVTHMLVAPESDSRKRMLHRVFDFLEELLEDGGEVENLAFIALLEGQSNSWLQYAKPYLGSKSESALDEFEPRWRERALRDSSQIDLASANDLYGIQNVVAKITGTENAA